MDIYQIILILVFFISLYLWVSKSVFEIKVLCQNKILIHNYLVTAFYFVFCIVSLVLYTISYIINKFPFDKIWIVILLLILSAFCFIVNKFMSNNITIEGIKEIDIQNLKSTLKEANFKFKTRKNIYFEKNMLILFFNKNENKHIFASTVSSEVSTYKFENSYKLTKIFKIIFLINYFIFTVLLILNFDLLESIFELFKDSIYFSINHN